MVQADAMMYTIDLLAVAQSNYPEVIRRAASTLHSSEYTDVGTFLKELSKKDLEELLIYSSSIIMGTDYTGAKLDSIFILSQMLAQAEGLSLDQSHNRAANLMILLNFESLSRRRVLDFDRTKATLGEELGSDKGLVKLK